MMKILLLLPPITLEERYNKSIAKAAGTLPPLGLLYLAAVLKEDNEVRVFDGSLYNYSRLMKIIREFKPDFVGIQSMYIFWPTIKKIVPEIREILPNVHISLGGEFATLEKQKCLKELKELDSLVIGEAEETIVELVGSIKKGKNLIKIKGIIFRDKQVIITNESRQSMRNIDKLPFPARELIDLYEYLPAIEQYKRKPMTNMITMRGCPYECTFCAQRKGNVRFRSPENVVEEMKLLAEEFSIKEIAIWDDTFTLDRKRSMKIMNRIRKENLDITFSLHSRINLIDRELLKEMKKSGCWKIFYGVESLIQKNLDVLKKGLSVNQIYDTIKLTGEEGIESEVSIMFGLPGETYTDCLETIKRLKKLNPDYAKFSYLAPAGQLLNTITNYGRIVSTDLLDYGFDSKVVFVPDTIKKEQLQTILPKAYRSFYLRPSYIFRQISKIRHFEDAKRAFKGLRAVLSL